tara:strand:+ start:273 stop:1022 length:750 start_codon:yes stop_codon:yes gene_type:complete
MAKLSRYERIQKEIEELESLIPDRKKFNDQSNYMFAVREANQKKGFDIGRKITNLRKKTSNLEKQMGTKYSNKAADLYIGDDISGGRILNKDYQERFDAKSELSIAKRQYKDDVVDKMTQEQSNIALKNYNFQMSQQEESKKKADHEGKVQDLMAETGRNRAYAEDAIYGRSRQWTTDQGVDDTGIPPDEGGKGGISESTSKKMGAIERENRKRFGDKKIDDLKIRHADWKKARKAGTLDQWRKKYGVS